MAVTAASTDQLFRDYDHDNDYILGSSGIITSTSTSTNTANTTNTNSTSTAARSAPSPAPPPPPSRPSTSTAGGLFSRRPSLFGGSSKATKAKSSSHKHSHSTITTNTHLFSSRTESPPTIYLPPPSPTSSSSTAATANTDAAQYEPPPKVPATPHRRKHASRHSISSSVADIGSQLRRSRSASLRTNNSSNTSTNGNGTPPRPSASSHKRTPSYTLALSFSPEKNPPQNAAAAASRPALSISTFSRSKQKSSESVKADGVYEKSPLSAVDKPKTPYGMAVPLRHPPSQKEIQLARQNTANSFNGSLAPAAPIALPTGSNPNIIFQHIQEMASKRISTLDYLRKAHEGRIYWFNTLLFSKNDLTRLPSFTPRNLSRRATQYLLLGFSLPTILDLNANSPADYLKALNALLMEFEQYQSIHPADGSAPSSLSRARIPQMFKRVNVGGKGRRSSSAAGDFPLLTPQNSFNEPMSAVDSPPTDDLLLPNESYSYLQTPSLPFDPDFFSTFATLCDVLIDCYTKILSLLSTPESVAAAGGGVPSLVGELFNKADAKVRKIILAGVVREFEESCRQGVRGEVGGVGKVVLGGLIL